MLARVLFSPRAKSSFTSCWPLSISAKIRLASTSKRSVKRFKRLKSPSCNESRHFRARELTIKIRPLRSETSSDLSKVSKSRVTKPRETSPWAWGSDIEGVMTLPLIGPSGSHTDGKKFSLWALGHRGRALLGLSMVKTFHWDIAFHLHNWGNPVSIVVDSMPTGNDARSQH